MILTLPPLLISMMSFMPSDNKSRCSLIIKLSSLSLCLFLTACDSSSFASNVDKQNNQITTDSQAPDQTANDYSESSESEPVNALYNAQPIEGQSLMAAAKSDRKSSLSDFSGHDKNTNNMLEATLIGDYAGTVPCSSCDHTEVTLNLFADGSIIKTSLNSDPQIPKTLLIKKGIYRQDGRIITIVYKDQNIENYDIQDNHLVLMNNDKQPDADYTLSRK